MEGAHFQPQVRDAKISTGTVHGIVYSHQPVKIVCAENKTLRFDEEYLRASRIA
jgi:hypothetical protein